MQGHEIKDQTTFSNGQPRQVYNNTANNITRNKGTQEQYLRNLNSTSFNSKSEKGLTTGNHPMMYEAKRRRTDYLLTYDPSLLITKVPVDWPPTSLQVRH